MRVILAVLLGLALSVTAQQNPAAQGARQWREGHERAILGLPEW
jgi:hypothetical protein